MNLSPSSINLSDMKSSTDIDTKVERRRFSRRAGDFDVDVVLLSGTKSGDQFASKVINVSKDGLCVLMPRELQGGDRLFLTIYTGDDNSMCDGKVIWQREIKGQAVCGIKILSWTYMDATLERSLPRS